MNKMNPHFFLKKHLKYPLSLAVIFSSALYGADTTPAGVTVESLGDAACSITGNNCYNIVYDKQAKVTTPGPSAGYTGDLTFKKVVGQRYSLKYNFFGSSAFIEKFIFNGTGADGMDIKIEPGSSFAGSGIKQGTVKNATISGDYMSAGGPPQAAPTKIDFTGGKDGTTDITGLFGNVKNYNGEAKLTFSDAAMVGDLIAGVSGGGYGRNTVTFKDASLSGNITSENFTSQQNAFIKTTAFVKQTVTFDGVAPSIYSGDYGRTFSLKGDIITNFGTVDVTFSNSAVMIGSIKMTKDPKGASGPETLTSSTTLTFDHSALIGNITQDGADKGTLSFNGNNAFDSFAMKGTATNTKGEMDITLKGGAKWVGDSTTNLAIANSGTTTINLSADSSIEGNINNSDGTLTLTLDNSALKGDSTLIGGDVNITANNNSKIGSFDGAGGKLIISLDSSSSAGDIKNNDEDSSVDFTHKTTSTKVPDKYSGLTIGDIDFGGKLSGTLEFYKIGSISNNHNASSDLTITTSSTGDINNLDKLILTNTSTGDISNNSNSATLDITQKDQSMGNIAFAGTLKATLDNTVAKQITITGGTADFTLSNKSSTGSIKSLGGTTTLLLDGSEILGGLTSDSSTLNARLTNESLIHGDLLSSSGTSNVSFENGASVLGSMIGTAGEMNTAFSSDSTKIVFADLSTLFPSMDVAGSSPIDFSTLSDDQKRDLVSSVSIVDVIKYLNASKISNYDGNITTNGGTHKVDFQDSLYLGGFVNTTSGTANITLSFSDDFITKLKGNQFTNYMLYEGSGPDFYVNTSGDGINNIALSGSIKGRANFNYSGGHTNIIFSDTILKSTPIATPSTSTLAIGDTTDFNDKNVFDPSSSDASKKVAKINGHTFEDGLLIQLDSDKANSILSSYRDLYPNNSATFNIDKITDANTYSAKIQGVVVGDVYSLANSASAATKNYEALLEKDAVFIGSLHISDRNVSVELSKGSKLILSDGSTIAKLSSNKDDAPTDIDFSTLIGDTLTQGNTIIDLATQGISDADSAIKSTYTTLNISEVTDLSSTVFRVSYNPQASADAQENNKSDHIIISKANTSNGELQNYLQAYQNASDFVIGDLSAKNILVLSVANDNITGKPNMNFNHTSSVQQGYDVISTSFETRQEDSSHSTAVPKSSADSTSTVAIGAAEAVSSTDSTGSSSSTDSSASLSKAWTNYYVKSADAQIMKGYQDNTQAAISTNYDIFLSNINDLNKRLGELRGNPNEQGVWARIFNGMNTSNRGEEVSIYSTDVQGGYDFSIPHNGARSYFGAALSYGYNLINGASFTGKAQSIEVGAYYSFVSDEGFYTDTILKYAFILNQLSLPKNQNTQDNLNSSTISIGEEFGYRWNFLLKENQNSRHSLYLEPQAEFILGYVGNGTFNQVNGNSYLNSSIDSILAFRGRIGGVMGYAFKTAKNQTDFRLGLSYVGDVAGGGDIGMKTNFSEMNTTIASNQMGMVSLGVNSILSDQWRVYADLDTSFGGQYFNQTYLISIGGRYAFGKQSKNTPSAKARQMQKNPSNETQDTQAKIPSGYYWLIYGVRNDSKLSTEQENLIKKYPYVITYDYQTIKDKSGKSKRVLFRYYLLGGFKSKDGAIKNQKVADEVAQILNNKKNIEAILKEVK